MDWIRSEWPWLLAVVVFAWWALAMSRRVRRLTERCTDAESALAQIYFAFAGPRRLDAFIRHGEGGRFDLQEDVAGIRETFDSLVQGMMDGRTSGEVARARDVTAAWHELAKIRPREKAEEVLGRLNCTRRERQDLRSMLDNLWRHREVSAVSTALDPPGPISVAERPGPSA